MTDLDIANLALSKLGVNPITSFADGTKASNLAARWYPAARDSMLRAHPWNWARVWTTLAQDAAVPIAMAIKPSPEFQSEIIFTAMYPLPADCIRVYRAAPYNYNFRIVGKKLYTDAAPQALNSGQFIGAQPGVGLPPLNSTTSPNTVGVEYVTSVVDPGVFDSMFVEALAAKIAGHLAIPLPGNLQFKTSCEEEAKALILEAWFVDGAEQWNDELYDNILTDVRNTVGSQSGSIPY